MKRGVVWKIWWLAIDALPHYRFVYLQWYISLLPAAGARIDYLSRGGHHECHRLDDRPLAAVLVPLHCLPRSPILPSLVRPSSASGEPDVQLHCIAVQERGYFLSLEDKCRHGNQFKNK